MDVQKFTEAILPLRDKLYYFALKLLQNDADAEDNVQETFLRMWAVRHKLEQYRNLGGLAMQINKNLCLDKLRTRRNKTTLDNLNADTDGQTVHTSMELKQAVDMVGQLIKKLPALQQMIIRLRDVEGYDIEEIASITASKPESVRVNLSRARQRIREQYFKLLNVENSI